MTPEQYLIVVLSATAGGATMLPLASIYLISKDFLRRVEWEDNAELQGKVRVTARWTHDHTRWREMRETAAYGGAALGATIAILVPFFVGLHSIFLA